MYTAILALTAAAVSMVGMAFYAMPGSFSATIIILAIVIGGLFDQIRRKGNA